MTDEVVTVIEQPALVVTVPLGVKGDRGEAGQNITVVVLNSAASIPTPPATNTLYLIRA